VNSYTQHSGNVSINCDSNAGSYGINANRVTLNGGKLTINVHGLNPNAIYASVDITINGGQLDATNSGWGNSIDLYAKTGDITLGWTNATDYIHATNYFASGTVSVKDGQVFVTNDDTPVTVSGTITDMSLINGKTLTPKLVGSGTTDDPYLITNAGGWDLFCDLVQNSIHTFQGNVKLGADISVRRMAGSESKPFAGNFDGQDYTLTFNCNTSDDYVAPFRYVTGGIGNVNNHATISNLNVVSTINGSTHLAGLIANQKGLVDLTNCHVTATIASTTFDDSYCAGLVSHAAMRDPQDESGYGNVNDGTLTISGCTVSGSISIYGSYAGGFVGMAEGKTSIVNSASSVTINSFVGDEGTHGGFIGLQQHTLNYANVSTTITGCLFNGKLITSNGTTNCGGFIGWHDGGSLQIEDCLYAPAAIESGETEISDGYTFVGNGTVGDNCIYTRTLGTAQGKATHNITAGDYVTISNMALINFLSNPDVYNVSGITSYDWDGISCGGTLYICEGAHVSLVLSNDYTPAAPAGSVYGYTATAGTLSGTNPYTLTMPNEDVIINVDTENPIALDWGGTGTEDDPYMIYNKDQLDLLAYRMYHDGYNYGTQQDYQTHPNGYFFKLGADIVYPYTSDTENNFIPIGNGGMYPYPAFQGTFDGDGHTISGIRINEEYLNYNDYYFASFGLFGELYGTVKNVILADAIITGSSNVGGIAGYNGGTLENNLVIGATISATSENSHGVICGSNNHGTLEHNYYVACTVGGVENATGVGCGYIEGDDYDYITDDITDNDGAMPGNARTVEGYGDSEEVGWTFIASPLTENTDPDSEAVVDIFTADEYDLYRLNPSNMMWENYKQHNTQQNPFLLVNGQGYLYATQTKETVKFVGQANAFNLSDTKEVTLPQGFNLVGNPFPRAAYITKSYYTLNEDGSAVSTSTSNAYIPPCTGVVVEVEEDGEIVTFSTTNPAAHANGNQGNLNITLAQASTRSKALLDKAVVSFNEGCQLGKFYFGTQNANLYIPQNGKDYAIVCGNGHNEMPVKFRANENGEYTISVNPENVEMAYLHLIDNLTGSDVDLLQTPEYTFTAKTTDYESRFKLVFVANNEDGASTDSETFAFINNGNIIINGEGILQVVDVMGRILISGNAKHCVSTKGITPGVYVLRLINDNDMRTQKMVIN
jgi:hypothetical protein